MCLVFRGVLSSKREEKTDSGDKYNTLFFVNEMPGGGISVDKVKDYARNECKVGDNIECEVYVNPYVTKKGAPMHTIVVSKDGAFINLGSGSPKEKGVRV